MSSKLRI